MGRDRGIDAMQSSVIPPTVAAADLVEAIRQVGVGTGDTVYVQVCTEGLADLGNSVPPQQLGELVYTSFREVVGDEGTILAPAFTFSFCRQDVFDVERTPTVWGRWNTCTQFPELVRRLPGALRSRDPIFSTAGIGPKAAELLMNLPHVCLGEDCLHDRLRRVGGQICILGVGLYEAIFRHFVEAVTRVPWRYDKLFTGYVRENGVTRKEGWLYNVRILAENGDPAGEDLETKARALNTCRSAPVGGGEILAVDCQEFFDLAAGELRRNPWSTARGPAGNPVDLEESRVGGPRYDVRLRAQASMVEMISGLWRLPRDLVSSGYDAALAALADQVPMTIHEYPTGTPCWTWTVPEKWTCHEAYLETLDGRRLFSYSEHPLHVVSYSLPFEGEVSREELLRHLHVHPRLPDAIPFMFKYYDRDWGLCCSQTLRDSLHDERYRVVIRTAFSYGTLKVGEVVARGQSDECIVLCAHLCHPAMVNDDLTGVVVGIEVMRRLLARRDLRYTYRFLIVPETIGSIAYLSRHEELIPKMKGGLFLEMLGMDQPHALQRSFADNTDVDRCFAVTLREHDPHGWIGAFRTTIGNDERQFNAPGVRVPMLSLSRVLPQSDPGYPYREYHSSWDTPEVASVARLEESRDLVLAMIETLESDRVPVNEFRGEVCLARHGLEIDWYADRHSHRSWFDVMYLIDGTRSITALADACGISVAAAKQVVDQLAAKGLVSYRCVPEREEPGQ